MKSTFTLMLSTVLCCHTWAQQSNPITDKRLQGLDTAFSRVLREWHAAGFAVAVVEKNKLVYAGGFGYADYENKIPVTANTVFATGSCTKAFTASLLGLLRQDGLIDFDKPVRNYLPALKFYNPEMNSRITVKDLMCHRTGLPRHDYAWALFKTKSRDSLLQRVQFQQPNADIREKWQYNNFMYLAQGMIAEKLTSKSWEANMQERILRPLGMTHTNFSVDSMGASPAGAKGYRATPKGSIEKLDYFNLDVFRPVGGINAPVTDMANWVMAWINNGRYKGKEILPPSYIREAISSQMVVAPGVPAPNNPDVHFSTYGLGWFLASYRGHYRVEHGGNINGFTASTCFFPTDSIGIVVLCNQDVSSVTAVVRNLVADRMLKLPYKDWQTYLKTAANAAKAAGEKGAAASSSSKQPATKPSHAAKAYDGIYNNDGYGKFDIVNRNDSLFALFTEDTWWLKHYHYDVFEAYPLSKEGEIETNSGSDTRIQFNMDESGNISSAAIALEPGLPAPILFTRSIRAAPITVDELAAYTGNFTLVDMEVKVLLKKGVLFLVVPGQPEYELVPGEKDKFNLKGVQGYAVSFKRSAAGVPGDMLVIQPNGTFTAKRKP